MVTAETSPMKLSGFGAGARSCGHASAAPTDQDAGEPEVRSAPRPHRSMDRAIGVPGPRDKTRERSIVVVAVAVLVGCTPLYMWDINTTSTARPPSFDVGELSREPVATPGLVAPAGAPGIEHGAVSRARRRARAARLRPSARSRPARSRTRSTIRVWRPRTPSCSRASPAPASWIVSDCSESDRRLASAICCVPGLAQLDHVILDRFEIAGIKVIRTRVTVLRVWLQLWDTRTGHILWESAGEVATASEVVRHERIVPDRRVRRKGCGAA